MQASYPGGLLTFLTVLTIGTVAGCLYLHWTVAAALLAPLALCHVGVVYQVRFAAWVLVTAYVVGCLYLVWVLVSLRDLSPPAVHAIEKLAFNVWVLSELRRWLHEHS